MTTRKALEEFANLLKDKSRSLIVTVLPTGYGKSQFFKYYKELLQEFSHVVHVLPLQALVNDLVCKLGAKLSKFVDVCYQMGTPVKCSSELGFQQEAVLKSPLLACGYTISTTDSYLLDYFGIPVHQIYRTRWHSDVALTMSHVADLTIFDEVHLMISTDVAELHSERERKEEPLLLLAKQVASLATAVKTQLLSGLRVCVMTATLTPSLLRLLLDYAVPNNDVNATTLLYAPSSHTYVQRLESVLKRKGVELRVVDPEEKSDVFYASMKDYSRNVRTIVKPWEIDKTWRDVDKLVREVEQEFVKHCEELGLSPRRPRILFVLNSAIRAWRTYKELKERLPDSYVLLVHGKSALNTKAEVVRIIQEVERVKLSKPFILVATQCVEAGLDADFDVLITEAAPPFPIIQRVGRVCRRSVRPGLVVVLYPSNDEVLKVCRGVYDPELTKLTFEWVKQVGKYINWRVPVPDEKPDYLRLLTYVDDRYLLSKLEGLSGEVEREVLLVSSLLEELLEFTLTPDEVLQSLDRKLQGSFIRKCMLMTLVDIEIEKRFPSGVIKQEEYDEVFNYLFTVDTYVVKKLRDRFVEDGKVTVYYLYRIGDELKLGKYTVPSYVLDKIVEQPLTTMSRLHRQIVREPKKSGDLLNEIVQEIREVRLLGLGVKVVEASNVEIPELGVYTMLKYLSLE